MSFVFLALGKIKLTSVDAIELIKMLIQFDRSEGEMCFFDFCTQHLHSKFCEHNFRMVINEERANVQLLANAELLDAYSHPGKFEFQPKLQLLDRSSEIVIENILVHLIALKFLKIFEASVQKNGINLMKNEADKADLKSEIFHEKISKINSLSKFLAQKTEKQVEILNLQIHHNGNVLPSTVPAKISNENKSKNVLKAIEMHIKNVENLFHSINFEECESACFEELCNLLHEIQADGKKRTEDGSNDGLEEVDIQIIPSSKKKNKKIIKKKGGKVIVFYLLIFGANLVYL